MFALVLCAALLHAVWNALVKINGDRLIIMATIMVSQSLIACAVLPFLEPPQGEVWHYIWASIVLHNGYYFFLIMAYRYGDFSHVYPIARGSAPLIVGFVSVVFIGEVLSDRETFSIALIALGIISLAFTRGASRVGDAKAIFFALGTGAFIAGYTIVDGLGGRLALDVHAYTFWLFALDGIPIAVLALLLRRGQVVRQVQRTWKAGVFAGVASLIAYWIVIWAMTSSPIPLVSATRETSMVFAVLIGVLFLKERLNLLRLAASIVTLAGAVLLKTSK